MNSEARDEHGHRDGDHRIEGCRCVRRGWRVISDCSKA
jgi:hypothetical protein